MPKTSIKPPQIKPAFFATPAAFRQWLMKNHALHLEELGRRSGFSLSIEPHDMTPCADLSLGGIADVRVLDVWIQQKLLGSRSNIRSPYERKEGCRGTGLQIERRGVTLACISGNDEGSR